MRGDSGDGSDSGGDSDDEDGDGVMKLMGMSFSQQVHSIPRKIAHRS